MIRIGFPKGLLLKGVYKDYYKAYYGGGCLGALILRIGFGVIFSIIITRNPQNNISNY